MKSLLLAASVVTLAVVVPAAGRAPGSRLLGGTAKIYLGGYPDKIYILDEATERVEGAIQLKTGVPHRMIVSQDRTRFYLLNAYREDIEIVDIASRKVVDTFRLTQGTTRVRIFFFEADPTNSFMVLGTRAATRQTDRWEIAPAALLLYDLRAHRVERTIPWPEGEEREPGRGSSLLFSPDGRFLYLLGRDIVVYDTVDWKPIDTWQLSRPVESGFGALSFESNDTLNEEPGYYTGVFTTEDPVQRRRVAGVARINLSQKRLDFFAVGPSQGKIGSFSLAPGGTLAYGLLDRVGDYEFWAFDLGARRLRARTPFQGRPRMALKVSSNGTLLYIHEAGNTIDLYEASTGKYVRTVTLDFDMRTDLFILPTTTR